MFDVKLGQLFNFTADDLEANRAGHLSNKQAQGFKDGNRNFLIGAIVLFGLFGLMTLIAFSGSFDAPSNLPQTLLVFTGIAGLGVGIAWYGRDETYYLYHIEGLGQLTTDMGKYRRYTLNINGYVFILSPDQYNLLENGENYTIYYATQESNSQKLKTATKSIQSIEVMRTE